MDLKSIIALFVGLVVQFSHAQSALATGAERSCGGSESMSCCAEFQSCPCADSGNSDQKSPPLAPASADLKWLVAKLAEREVTEVLIEFPAIVVGPSATSLEFSSGYLGVPLSVAFCRFVI